MDPRPQVTYSGDSTVFTAIEQGLVGGLPAETVEWKRSYGRPSKLTTIECSFSPFDAEVLEQRSGRLQGQPVFHTFWTDVTDLDTYKQGLREEILGWQASIRKTGVSSDWMVVVVEAPDSKKTNKFPLRTTVLERLRQDVGGKTPERCVVLVDPSKSGDSRAAESLQALLQKFRQFFLISFNKVLNKFEEQIRHQREKRTEARWNFCHYFLLQEELAMVYEAMGLHEESLVQYDELDALFTQFVLNCNVGETPAWLEQFERSPSDWSGPSLDRDLNLRLQARLASCCPSLLDLRNYLFSRQAQLLLLGGQGSEVARRALVFLHNTLQELDTLEVERGLEGSRDCWVLLTCLEVLQACSRQEEAKVSLHTADLWAYAREKLLALGTLCGLGPSQTPTSEQLHLMVTLTSGIQEDRYLAGGKERNPLERLRDGLSSNLAFQKNYLEMCEIAISSYKHIGRIRSARLVGRQLAAFYLQLGERQQAASFLADALKTFQGEGWGELAARTMLDLATCYRELGEREKLVRICAQVAASECLELEERESFLEQMVAALGDGEEEILVHAADILEVVSCTVDRGPEEHLVPGAELSFSLVLTSRLPRTVSCSLLQVALEKLEQEPEPETERKSSGGARRGGSGLQRSPSAASSSTVLSLGPEQEVEGEEQEDGRLDIVEQLDYKQDKSLMAARLVCRNPGRVLRRKDSSGSILKEGGVVRRATYGPCLEARDMELVPGTQTYRLTTVAGEEGRYQLLQLSVALQPGLELLADLPSLPSFTVTSVRPAVALHRTGGDLWAGLRCSVLLSVHTGSLGVEEGTLVQLSCSRGLSLGLEGGDLGPGAMVPLPGGRPFTTVTVRMEVMAALGGQKDSSSVEHRVSVRDPWAARETEVFLHFVPAFYSTVQLQTALEKKFLQVLLHPLVPLPLTLTEPRILVPDPPDLSLTPLHEEAALVVACHSEAGFLWSLGLEALRRSDSVKGQFLVEFSTSPSSSPTSYAASFHLTDLLTLYMVQAKVEPAQGSEFLRAGTLCPLTVVVEQSSAAATVASLYYEVIADQAVWAVCGRQGAVVQVIRRAILVNLRTTS